jgi:chromatin segregation and condensation protein Rec8/ScpA/Scc1 (kleisin family)
LRERCLRGGNFVIGFLGSFFSFEGLPMLVQAFAVLRLRYPGARLVLVGDGEDRSKVEQMIAKLDRTERMEIDVEKMSLADRINEIMDKLTERKHLTFTELLEERIDRRWILYTFLAVLELMKLKMIKAYQGDSFGVIRIFLAVE